MRGRHLQTLIGARAGGFWGFGVYFAHEHGHLRFLDRVESTTIDLRTLFRGVRVPPDPVTIVAIDDALVKQGGSYPVARGDLARIVDANAKLAPKVIAIDLLLVDRGTDDGDDALAKSLAGRRTAIAAAAVFPESRQSIAAQTGRTRCTCARYSGWKRRRHGASPTRPICCRVRPDRIAGWG
jgi:adenylate cyclase